MSDTIKSSAGPSTGPSSAPISERLTPTAAQRHVMDRQLDLELTRLARRIEELVAMLEHLKEENRALRQRHESLANERASLLQKNELARTRVDAMISRLKTLEHGA